LDSGKYFPLWILLPDGKTMYVHLSYRSTSPEERLELSNIPLRHLVFLMMDAVSKAPEYYREVAGPQGGAYLEASQVLKQYYTVKETLK
jgi:hypothetical protein